MSKYKNGILVVSHGPLASAIVSSAEMILGKISDKRLETLTLDVGANVDLFYETMNDLVENLLVNNEKVIILTDLLGGTPNNTALKIAIGNERVSVITGYNLMVLIEIFSNIDNEIDNDNLIKSGREFLLNLNTIVVEEEEEEEWL